VLILIFTSIVALTYLKTNKMSEFTEFYTFKSSNIIFSCEIYSK